MRIKQRERCHSFVFNFNLGVWHCTLSSQYSAMNYEHISFHQQVNVPIYYSIKVTEWLWGAENSYVPYVLCQPTFMAQNYFWSSLLMQSNKMIGKLQNMYRPLEHGITDQPKNSEWVFYRVVQVFQKVDIYRVKFKKLSKAISEIWWIKEYMKNCRKQFL